ncbi:DNA helicase RecG, partial [Patescibacteria group bacterium]|nr:DNA helicase RecG [Patescibacteria group bacterium]
MVLLREHMSLDSSVGKLPFVGPVYVRRLEKLNIETVEDLLHHPPSRYLDYSQKTKVRDVRIGDTVTVEGEMSAIQNIYTKSGKKIQLANITDDSGNIKIIWFNQPFLSRTIKRGDVLSLSGKVDWYNKKPAFISPDHENLNNKTKSIHTGRLVPIYSETA